MIQIIIVQWPIQNRNDRIIFGIKPPNHGRNVSIVTQIKVSSIRYCGCRTILTLQNRWVRRFEPVGNVSLATSSRYILHLVYPVVLVIVSGRYIQHICIAGRERHEMDMAARIAFRLIDLWPGNTQVVTIVDTPWVILLMEAAIFSYRNFVTGYSPSPVWYKTTFKLKDMRPGQSFVHRPEQVSTRSRSPTRTCTEGK